MGESQIYEQASESATCAIVYTKDDEEYDRAYTWETAQTMANEGYRIVAIADDGHMSKSDIQALCDRELAAALDCFGEAHRK